MLQYYPIISHNYFLRTYVPTHVGIYYLCFCVQTWFNIQEQTVMMFLLHTTVTHTMNSTVRLYTLIFTLKKLTIDKNLVVNIFI